MNKVLILYSEYIPVIDAIIVQNPETEFQTQTQLPESFDEFDLIININFEGEIDSNVLKCHHSLLPAFAGEEPVQEAFLAGVKVTGITIFYTKPQRILAQYPIFIKNESHFDEVEKELEYLEQVLLPLAVKKIINKEPVDSKSLGVNDGAGKTTTPMSGCSCCGGCSGCHH